MHHYNVMGEQRISIVPASIKSLPHTSFLDNHSSCIIEKSGETIETVNKTDEQNMKTIELFPTETSSSIPPILNTRSSLNGIHTSYKPLILAASQLLKKEPSFNRVPVSNKHLRRSPLPLLGDALSWLTDTATTKDVNSIKTRINQLIATQHSQQETLVHIISILNITRYATQFNRQHINIVMNAAQKMHQDVTTLYNITHSLYSSLSYQQIVLHI